MKTSAKPHPDLVLVSPAVELKKSFLAGLREFQTEGLPWHLDLDYAWIEAHFEEYVAAELRRATERTAGQVPKTRLWGVYRGEFAGQISIHHELNDALRVVGGHIGYDTRPPLRGLGVASRMLALALPIAKGLGLSRVMLTCDDTNAASIRVIEKNGGVLAEKRLLDPSRPLKRYYWIEL